METLTDEQLITQYKTTGCQDAFNTLYHRYQRLITAISNTQARAAGIDANEFISALNETFWRAVQRFDPARGEFCRYISRALKLAVINLYRNERNRRADDIDNCLGIGAEDDELNRVEIKVDLEAALNGDEMLAEIVRHFIAGYSREEIGQMIGRSREFVRRRLLRFAKTVSG